jgi:hypothetical protein
MRRKCGTYETILRIKTRASIKPVMIKPLKMKKKLSQDYVNMNFIMLNLDYTEGLA